MKTLVLSILLILPFILKKSSAITTYNNCILINEKYGQSLMSTIYVSNPRGKKPTEKSDIFLGNITEKNLLRSVWSFYGIKNMPNVYYIKAHAIPGKGQWYLRALNSYWGLIFGKYRVIELTNLNNLIQTTSEEVYWWRFEKSFDEQTAKRNHKWVFETANSECKEKFTIWNVAYNQPLYSTRNKGIYASNKTPFDTSFNWCAQCQDQKFKLEK